MALCIIPAWARLAVLAGSCGLEMAVRVFAAPTRTPTPEAIAALNTVEHVAIAPDGLLVAYLVGRESHRDGAEVRELWLVASDGSLPPRRLLARSDHVAELRWSPDSRRLALVAALDGARSLLLLDPATGAETLLEKNLPGAANLHWTPGGRALSFTRRDSSAAGAGRAAKTAARPPRALGTASPPPRVWHFDLATREIRALTPPGLSIGRYAWSPAGDALVAATTPADAWITPRETVMIFTLGAGAPPRTLFTAHDQTISIAWSPDGGTIAWCGREHTAGSSQFTLAAADGASPPRAVQADFPGSAEWLGFRPDGRIAFAAVVGLRVGIYTLAPDGSDLRTEIAPESAAPGSIGNGSFTTLALSYSADGTRIATSISGPGEPANVVAGPWGGPLRRLTRLNPEVASWALGKVEEVTWKGSDGLALQGMLLRPPGFDPARKYPLITEIHGGPRRSWWATSLLLDGNWAAWLASRGYLVFLPNPRGSEGRGAAFVRLNTNDLGGGDFRDVMSGVDHVVGLGFVDPERLGVAGWSYGGYLAAWTITQTPRFRAAVVGAGITNWISREGGGNVPGLWGRLHWEDDHVVWTRPRDLLERSPTTHAKNVRTPTLLLYGAADSKVPPGQAAEFYNPLRSFGVPVEAYVYPDAGHGFTDPAHKADVLRRVAAWFERWLGPAASG